MPVVNPPQVLDFGAQRDLLAGGNHPLPGMPFVVDGMAIDAGRIQGLGQFAPLMALDAPPIAQFRDEFIPEKKLCLLISP